jgi:stage II sporulation protein D
MLLVMFISLVVYPAFGKAVRVLLEQNTKAPHFYFLGPAEFSTGQQKISIYESRYQVALEFKKQNWILKIKTNYFQDQYQIRGDFLSISSLSSIQWNDKQLDFKTHLVVRDQLYHLLGEMDMNRYLQGVIPHEMPASWPLESLKAQAVASRSYAYWKMRQRQSQQKLYDLRPSVLDQVFELPRWGLGNTVPPKVKEALLSTDGEVLFEKPKSILKAYFHSDCGGSTTTANAAWGESNTSAVAVKDPYCETRESQWSTAWSREKIQSRLMQKLVLPPGSSLKEVIPRAAVDSERVESVDFLFTQGVFKRLRAEELRQLLGYDKIKSTTFTISKNSSEWTFSGRGFGHGVGMCQHGARSMAQKGLGYRQILHHYYPKSSLRGIESDSVLLSAIEAY